MRINTLLFETGGKMRLETKTIVSSYYNEYDKQIFERFAEIIENDYKNVDKQREIWEYDQKLRGLGGYAAPLSPTINPFNSWGDYRNVFRSLQYARSDMFLCNRPRNIIIATALHIESLVKLVVSDHKIIRFVNNRQELGRNIRQLYDKNIIDNKLYERLNNLRKILNYAKHDTDPYNSNTFDYEDAIVFYFECRHVGNELLQLLNHHTCQHIYKIQE